jgi:ferrous iron transport protein B
MICHTCRQTCHSPSPKPKWKWSQLFNSNRVIPTYISKKLPTVALVGSPNVGKSLLFNILTSTYVTVSNYPGTTVEVSRGEALIAGRAVTVVDTPGMYSLLSITEEERVSRDLLLRENIDLVIHVVDAKNIGRMLNLTFQLLEAHLPVLLAVNMIDEAEKWGLVVDKKKLETTLGIPVVTMSAALKLGIHEFQNKVAHYV